MVTHLDKTERQGMAWCKIVVLLMDFICWICKHDTNCSGGSEVIQILQEQWHWHLLTHLLVLLLTMYPHDLFSWIKVYICKWISKTNNAHTDLHKVLNPKLLPVPEYIKAKRSLVVSTAEILSLKLSLLLYRLSTSCM